MNKKKLSRKEFEKWANDVVAGIDMGHSPKEALAILYYKANNRSDEIPERLEEVTVGELSNNDKFLWDNDKYVIINNNWYSTSREGYVVVADFFIKSTMVEKL